MARVVGGIGISHSPSMGVAFDRGVRAGFDARWQAWRDGTDRVKQLLRAMRPDHLIVVYNDHLNHFDFDAYPTLAIGVGERFPQADEGWGVRPLPDLPGDPAWGIHLTESLVAQEFDLTVCHALSVDHGIYSWLPYLSEVPWPVTITPLAVNMVRQPLPTPRRLLRLGQALRRAVAARPGAERVVVIATGGMSHQISGARFGIANEAFDRYFLRALPDRLDELVALPTETLMRCGGTEAAELTVWFAMRSALDETARAVYDFYTFPQITGCGALVMIDPAACPAHDFKEMTQ
ncbi:DODA-type extradiol aromatic ring-opening family dioxygenase [Chitinasiproducens palmae]|uniref:Protocatechuate 4,5-dioxygenase beta subunit n=1 Tax=Chitinasiproducens palmae TaxID=1770053 RepID=A0A1H2PSW0_9BURK|nr:hypothetical protein [Chitinasiproducens palmae]SDV49720.1 protocatechuate 4,5-dioxygenase beta subunit [Chitinasiproducens palmae]